MPSAIVRDVRFKCGTRPTPRGLRFEKRKEQLSAGASFDFDYQFNSRLKGKLPRSFARSMLTAVKELNSKGSRSDRGYKRNLHLKLVFIKTGVK
ncbi:MAG TPA: hypothetical protein DD636_02070 [Anaerolineaceae bacterium]|nr:hypothetical protein [Anaerolineaceae bacterium]